MSLRRPGVYIIKNTLSGSCYVGSAVNIDQRWKCHRSSLKLRKKAPPKLQRAWDKYGEHAFSFEVLEYCDKEKTLEREQFWIDKLAPKYNTRPVAHSNLGVKWSDETNAKKGRAEKIYTVKGVTGSLGFLCAYFGVVSGTGAIARLARGFDIERAVTEPPMNCKDRGKISADLRKKKNAPPPRAKLLTFRGVSGSIKDIIERFAVVSVSTARARLARGWELEKALLTPEVPPEKRKRSPVKGAAHHKAKTITVAGFTGALVEVAEHFGVPPSMIAVRLRKGWSPEEAVFTPKNKGRAARPKGTEHHNACVFTVGDMTGNITDFAEKYGIPSSSISWRLRQGWDVEKALTTPPTRKGVNQWTKKETA